MRDPFWDVIKGIAVLLMLLGHSIEYGMGAEYFESKAYMNNQFFQFIYGFHMPLFMSVSGYFFYKSIQKRNLCEFAKKLCTQIVLPILSFCVVAFFLKYGGELSSMGLTSILKSFIVTCIITLWFLWAYLYSSTLLGICNKLKVDSWWVQLLIVIILYCTPDIFNTGNFKYMYPFFLLGYYCRKYDWLSHINNYNLQVGLASFLVYFTLMNFCYTSDTLIYTTQIYLFKGDGVLMHLYNDILRLVVGFFGVVGCVTLIKHCLNVNTNGKVAKMLVELGCRSLGIYCFQDMVVKYVPEIAPPNMQYITMPATFLVLLVFSYIATIICSKCKPLNILFLGGR